MANISEEKIFIKLEDILVDKFNIPREKINRDSHLENDFQIDSLDNFEFSYFIEQEFGILIDKPADYQFETVNDYLSCVYDLVNEDK